jgi:hypothetical protein
MMDSTLPDPVVDFVAEATTHMDSLLTKWYPPIRRLEPRLLQPQAHFTRAADISLLVVALVALISIGVGVAATWFACQW